MKEETCIIAQGRSQKISKGVSLIMREAPGKFGHAHSGKHCNYYFRLNVIFSRKHSLDKTKDKPGSLVI